MGDSPSIPDPNEAAIQGIQQQTADYPFSYLVSSLQQTGGQADLINPATGESQNYDFTGAGTAQTQNQVSNQMAQVLLDIQQGYGGQYISQRIADLQSADPQGYAAYGQLFDQINKDIAAGPPDQPLSQATQSAVLNTLQGSNSLSPSQLTQVQQSARSQNVATGIDLGNAPAQAEATAVVQATDQNNAAAQDAASKYLSEGVTPSDIQYRDVQQNLANLGAFINGQNPTAQFSSLSGIQQGAAPNPNTNYSQPTLNEAQGAATGISQANQQYGYANELSQGTANPYLSGLNIGSQALGTAFNLGYNPWGTTASTPQANTYSTVGSGYGINTNGVPATESDYSLGNVAG